MGREVLVAPPAVFVRSRARSSLARPRARFDGRASALTVALLVTLGLGVSCTCAPHAAAQAQTEARRDRVYLTQLSLLVDAARRLIAFSENNIDERDLIKFAHPLSKSYVELASHMLPPPKTAVAHPHLLLVVENLERALDSALANDMVAYQKRIRIARDELANLEAVLKQLKLRLPELSR